MADHEIAKKTLAQIAYEAAAEYNGDVLPWAETNQGAWNVAVQAAVAAFDSKIEATIVSAASDALMLLRSYAGDQDTAENRSASVGQFHTVMALVQLGHFAESGLSDATIAKLQRIETEASGVFGTAYISKSAGS